jgi:hypothetical protein
MFRPVCQLAPKEKLKAAQVQPRHLQWRKTTGRKYMYISGSVNECATISDGLFHGFFGSQINKTAELSNIYSLTITGPQLLFVS